MRYRAARVFDQLEKVGFLLTHKQMLVLTGQVVGKEDDALLLEACERGDLSREKVWGLYLYARNPEKLRENRAAQLRAFRTIIENGFVLSDSWLVNRLIKHAAQSHGWELDRSAVQSLVCDLVVEGAAIRIGAISSKGTMYTCTYPASKDSLFQSVLDYALGLSRTRRSISPGDLFPLKQELGESGKTWEVFVLDHLVYLGELDRQKEKPCYFTPGSEVP